MALSSATNNLSFEPDLVQEVGATDYYPLALPGESRPRRVLAHLFALFPIGLLLLLMPLTLIDESRQRILLTASLFLIFYIVRLTETGILLTFAYLCLMGGIRRWLFFTLGAPSQDVLLLVVPILMCLRFLERGFSKQMPRDTPLTRLLFWLLIIMGIQVFNPGQGGLEVGLAGILFYIVPIFWFYIGREFGTEQFVERLARCVIGISLTACLYGIYQTYYGFLASEEAFLAATGSTMHYFGKSIRVMAFFTHSGEYVFFLGKGIVVLWAYWLYRRRSLVLLPIPLLAAAIFMMGTRGPVVTTLGIGIALYAVQARSLHTWILRGALALGVTVFGMFWSLQQVHVESYSTQTRDNIQHQVDGLLNPFDNKKSTAGLHTDMMSSGFRRGFLNPVGMGLGATTQAAAKFGGNGDNTEVDISNMFVSLGLIGGTLYLAVVIVSVVSAFRYWHLERNFSSLFILAILLISINTWLNGALYAHSALIWLCIGALDRGLKETSERQRLSKEIVQ